MVAGHGRLFLLFFAANYQPSRSRFRQKSRAADGSAKERTASPLLFRRCLFLKHQHELRSWHYAVSGFNAVAR